MDPGVYARAFGVQSEANKVTVTRVACNEIVYRRVVNTYRRDMNSTVNSIRRAQKKLRGCMRGYRKKLNGNQRQKPYKYGWIANTHPDDDIDLRVQYYNECKELEKSESQIKTGIGSPEKTGHFEPVDTQIDPLPTINRMNYPTRLQAQVDAFIKAPNIKVRPRPKPKEDVDNKDKQAKNASKKERRLFRIGSGKIRSTERTLRDVFPDGEENDLVYFLSDSSDDEGPIRGSALAGKRDPDRNRASKAEGLIYSKGAYFKPIETPINSELIPDNNQTVNDPTGELGTEISTTEATNIDPTVGGTEVEGTEAKPEDESETKLILPSIFALDQLEAAFTDKDDVTDDPLTDNEGQNKKFVPRTKKPHRKDMISFGDLAKLQHGLKTKTLFSLVDKLASRHGITGDMNDNNKSKNLPIHAKINFEKSKSFFKNNSNDSKSVNGSLTTYSSVFYAMKYGYGNSNQTTTNRDNPPSPVAEEHEQIPDINLGNTDSGTDSDHTHNISTRLSHIELDENPNASDRNLLRTDTILPLQTVSTGYSGFSGRRGSESSPSFGQDDVERSIQEVQAMRRHRGSRYQRQLRRDSMLEASEFVNSLRSKKPGTKKSFSSEMGSFNKRKDSTNDPDEDELSPDIHKVTWSSALSRIKLVHTLADLTHII